MSDVRYLADKHGKFTLAEVKTSLVTLQDTRDLMVRRKGFSNWIRVEDVAELRTQIVVPPSLPISHPDAPKAIPKRMRVGILSCQLSVAANNSKYTKFELTHHLGRHLDHLLQFSFLFFIFLSFAAVNGFPLYHWDSVGYIANPLHYDDFRSVIPALVSYPISLVVNLWALPVINSCVLALVFVRFFSALKMQFSYIIALFVSLTTSIPLFTGYIMPDIWGLILLICLIMLLVRWSLLDFIFASVSAMGHGSGILITLALMPLAWVACSFRKNVIIIFSGVLIISFFGLAGCNKLLRGRYFPDTYAWSIVASKMLNDVPSALVSLCRDEESDQICIRRDLIEPGPKWDDFYIWSSRIGIMNQSTGGLTLSQMNDSGRKLFWYAVFEHPVTLLKETLLDLVTFYAPSNWIFEGYTNLELRPKQNNTIFEQDEGRFVRNGLLETTWFRFSSYFLNTATMISLILLGIFAFPNMPSFHKRAFVMLLLGILANDFVFAFLSAPAARYHLRMLGVFVPIALMIYTSWRPASRTNKTAVRIRLARDLRTKIHGTAPD